MRLITWPARASARSALMFLFCVTAATNAPAQTVAIDQVPPIALTTSQSTSAVTVDPATGNVSIVTAAGNYNSCTNVVTPPPTINTFYPASTQVSTGALITLNWSSSNATACTPQQGSGTTWASLGTLPATGSQTLSAPATAGTVTFQLTCTSGARSDTKTTQVTVQAGGGGGAACTQTYPNTTVTEFNTYFGTWPAFGHSIRIGVPFNGALSWRFTATSSTTQFGSIATVGFPGDGDGWGQISISRSPGCFNPAEIGANCVHAAAREPSTGWANFANQFSCPLTPGQVYYVNLTYGGSTFSANGPYCPNGISCSADIQNQVQD